MPENEEWPVQMRELVEISPGVLVATSRREATTSTVLVDGTRALLVDPAWDPEELEGLADALADRGLHVQAGIATHAHHDHILWHPRFLDVPRCASAATVAIVEAEREGLLEALGRVPDEMAELAGRVEARSVPWEGVELIEHDGHIAGHLAVVVPSPGVLIAGDMLSDVELPLPDLHFGRRCAEILRREPEDPIQQYLVALDRLESAVRESRWVVPGHGAPGRDGLDRLHRDRAYLEAILAGQDPEDPRRSNPGMEGWHRQLVASAKAGPQGPETH